MKAAVGLRIEATGMVSSVGWTAHGTAAAVRAGISRPRPLPGQVVVSDDFGEDSIAGCPIRGFTEGFSDAGRWVRLGAGAIADMLRSLGLEGQHQGLPSVGVVAVLPELDHERFDFDLEEFAKDPRRHFFAPVMDGSRLGGDLAHCFLARGGDAGLARALNMSEQMLDSATIEKVVIVAADSLVDPSSLDLLARQGRLKAPDNAHGLIPGEAGVCALVSRDSQGPAILGAHTMVQASEGVLDVAGLGFGLADTIRHALRGAGIPRFSGDIYADLNGEAWRSAVWGHAIPRLLDVIDFERCRNLALAESLGHIGVASGLSAACLASRAFERGYASSQETLAFSVGDAGTLAAFVMQSG